jgi:hypothetical protein
VASVAIAEVHGSKHIQLCTGLIKPNPKLGDAACGFKNKPATVLGIDECGSGCGVREGEEEVAIVAAVLQEQAEGSTQEGHCQRNVDYWGGPP